MLPSVQVTSAVCVLFNQAVVLRSLCSVRQIVYGEGEAKSQGGLDQMLEEIDQKQMKDEIVSFLQLIDAEWSGKKSDKIPYLVKRRLDF